MTAPLAPLPEDTADRITVIVPIYNVADHVAACITSLRGQSHTAFDVLMIDDGSTDASAARALEAAGDDPRFRLISQDNAGLSAARNTGLEAATGDFIAFVDSDDRVAPDYLFALLAALQDAPDSPWVACAIRNRYADGQQVVHSAIFDAADPALAPGCQRFDFRSTCDVIRHYPSAWNKLYRRDFIGDLRFPEGVWFEDHAFYLTLALRAGHLLHLSDPLYEQTRGRPGQITETDSDRIFDQIDVLSNILPLLRRSPLPDGDAAAATLASRLLSERSRIIHAPDRRAAFTQQAHAFMEAQGIDYQPDGTGSILASWGLEMQGILPLSVIVPWDGRDDAPLRDSLGNLATQRGPRFEVLIVCDSAAHRDRSNAIAADALPGFGPDVVQVVVAQGRPRTMGSARQAGFARATGRFVVCLDAGDILVPDALQTRTEALLTHGAQVGLSARRHGIAGGQLEILPDAGFAEDYIPAHQDKPAAFTPTPRQVLEADLSISAAIFERSFLHNHALQPAATSRHGEWPLILGALLLCDTAAYLPAIDVTINPTPAARGVLSRPYALPRLNRDHTRLCSALPASAAKDLPSGWERRLLARAMRVWLLDGPARGRLGRLFALAGAAALIAARGMGRGDRFWPAGFDPQIGPKFTHLFDTRGLLRLLRAPDRHRDLSGVWHINPRSLDPGQPLHVFNLDASGTAQARLAVRFGKGPVQKLSFFTHNGRAIPLHIELDQAQGKISVNDTRSDGIWRAPRTLPHALPASGVDLDIEITPKSRRHPVRLSIGGVPVWTLKARTPLHRAGLTGLDQISHLFLQQGITPLDLGPDTPQECLSLDSRLQLRIGKAVTPETTVTAATADGQDHALDCLATSSTKGRALLPARLWLGQPEDAALILRLNTSTEPEQSLALTKVDLTQRIETLLHVGLPLSDADLAVHVIEIVAFAGLSPRLSPSAQTDLARLTQAFGLADLLPDLTVPPRHRVDQFATQTADIATHIRRAEAGTPLLHTLPAEAQASRHLTLQLVEWAIDQGRITDLHAEAKAAGTLPGLTPDSDIWTLSASVPFLWLEGRDADLLAALSDIASPRPGWRVSPALAWIGTAASLGTPAVRPETRTRALNLLLDWFDAEARLYWGRSTCTHLQAMMAAFVTRSDRLPRDLAERAVTSAIAAYGAHPPFWAQIPNTGPRSVPLTLARRACAQLYSETEPHVRAAALDQLQDLGLADSARARIEHLGPAGVALPQHAPLGPADLRPLSAFGPYGMGEAALRHMASPATAPVDADTATLTCETIRNLIPEQTTPPYLALHHSVHTRLTAFLAETEPHPEALNALLTDLGLLASPAAHYLGLGVAMTLLVGLDRADLRQPLAAFLLSTDVTNPEADALHRAPAVRMGLARLSARTDAEAQAVCTHFAPPAEAPPLPVLADGPLPAPHPLNDILVTVFSCHPFLDTRIPALRAGWLADLQAMGIPYVIVVGNGDNTLRDDVLHVDAPDDYEGLPAKTLATLDWVRRNTSHGHLFKTDDDCLVDAPALFGALTYRGVDYMGRRLTRAPGQMDRVWHQEKASSPRGKLELDKSPEPSTYADGGSGYTLSRDAIEAACAAARTPEGRRLIDISFMEDKLLGDLLALSGISLSTPGYLTSVRRRTHSQATPVAFWNAGFYPSLASPTQQVHMDTHLHQAEVLALRDKAVLEPRKVWPSFHRPRLGYQSNALELISPPDSVDRARSAEIAVVAVMRNEAFILPQFLAHYRRLGITSFLIADNVSDDGSREYLLQQDDVALFSVDTDYSQSHYGVAWQQALLHSFRRDRWSLVADADELLVWQANQTQTLPDLLSQSAFAEADAARVFMLDMYPQGPLDMATFDGVSPFDQAGFAERVPFVRNPLTRGPYSDQTLYTSALRHRLIPRTRPDLFASQKIALLKYQPHMRLSAGLHFVSGAQIAAQDLIFGHFKYNADFFRKAQAEVARKQHFNDAEEYHKYLELAAEGRAQIYDPDLSLPWADVPFVKARLQP